MSKDNITKDRIRIINKLSSSNFKHDIYEFIEDQI